MNGREAPVAKADTAAFSHQLPFSLTRSNHALYSRANVDVKIFTITRLIATIEPNFSLPHGDGWVDRYSRTRSTRSGFRNLNIYLRHR